MNSVPVLRRTPPLGIGDLRAFVNRHASKAALCVVIALVIAITASQSSVFFTADNFKNIFTQIAIVGILACGTTMLMVSGGIDLSIGSSVSFCGLLMAYLMSNGTATALAIAICVGAAAAVGAANGVLAAFSRSHPFVVTLGMLTVLQGGALLISQVPVTGLPDGFVTFTGNELAGVPTIVWIFLGVVVLVHVTLARTKLGRWLYAIGGAEPAARLAGVRVRFVKVVVYTLNGLLVGLAALLLVSQIGSADANMGRGMELSAIAAVAVGGTPLAGGKGDMLGTFLGVFLLGLIANALNLMSISPNWQFVIQGAVIVVAVMAQRGD